MYLVDRPPHSTFTAPELARLAAYRAAVAAGFYTDWDGSVATTDPDTETDTDVLASLSDDAEDPFTTEERQRLERLRQDVKQGRYADDQPAPPPTERPAAEPPAAEPPTPDPAG